MVLRNDLIYFERLWDSVTPLSCRMSSVPTPEDGTEGTVSRIRRLEGPTSKEDSRGTLRCHDVIDN